MYNAIGEGEKMTLTLVHPCHHFSQAEITSATNDFDDELIIGEGGFGKVYKGSICIKETSYTVAIKRLDSMSNQGAPEFRAEIEMLSKLRHCNLVSLIGYCDDNREMILVYLYMPRGTLYDHLHKAITPLSWVQRLKIAIGAGRGLDYLHTGFGTQHGVIHRDVKSSNILLDENWAAMISDFGLSKIGPIDQAFNNVSVSVKGTFGYLDPEYFYTSKLTRKTDVYAFGVVLFELLSGMLAVDTRLEEEQGSLARWAKKCVKERKFDQLVDSDIAGTITPRCLRGFAGIADRCLLRDFEKRPTMTQIVAKLQDLLEQQEKFNNSANLSGTTGFTWKIQKYLASATKQNSDQGGTSKGGPFKGQGRVPAPPKVVTSSANFIGFRGNLVDNTSKSTIWPPQNKFAPPIINVQVPPLGTRSQKRTENVIEYSSNNKDGGDLGKMHHQHGKTLEARDAKLFTYSELKSATRNFREITCHGLEGYGEIYKGWVDVTTYSPCNDNIGLPVAVKKIRHKYNFHAEVFKAFHHPNLVKLIGYCLEADQLYLVYEFMHNGNLKDLLRRGAIARLPLVTKVKIVVGIARGIVVWNDTIHEVAEGSWTGTLDESQFDGRTILLDEAFAAKLSGYRLTKLVCDYFDKLRRDTLAGCVSWCETLLLKINLDAFVVVFAEVLTGKELSYEINFEKIDSLLQKNGKNTLFAIAELCFEKCNEVDSELKLLSILNECDNWQIRDL